MHKAFLRRIVDEGPIPAVHGVVRWRASDLIMRLHEEFGLSVPDDTIYRALKDLGFSHVSARPKAYKQDADAMAAFKETLPYAWRKSARHSPPGTPVEVWFQDEMRVGQKNKLTYRWARKGSRPLAIHDQRTQSTYLFGALCPERGAGAALVLPACNTEAMQLHLARNRNESHPRRTRRSHSRSSWMARRAKDLEAPKTSRSCRCRRVRQELNPQNGSLCGRAGCRTASSNPSTKSSTRYAWNALIDQPWKIMSIARRDWAVAGHSL